MAWPIDEARQIASITDRPILFETGYGPSGLPHIGTFTEVARTTWVRQAFTELTGLPSRLVVFSDDMDGMRRVPDNVPNKELLEEHIGLPLTCVPDPFGTHQSFAHHNNAKLKEFLNRFGFEYEFVSATACYRSGKFDTALLRVLECHDEIVETIVPTLGADRAFTYSPFMPIHPKTGHVMQVQIDRIDLDAKTLIWSFDNHWYETPITGGHCKLQWKADWAMRWYALGVDYEMSGKDLIDSVTLSTRICKTLGGRPPVGMTYELFLDEFGKKISKSKGNGVTVEDWLLYGPPEGLAHYIFANPQRAKKLFLGIIPRATDEYIDNRAKIARQTPEERLENPVWYVNAGQIPEASETIPYNMLINLASVTNAEDPKILWDYIRCYNPNIKESSFLTVLLSNAVSYYQNFVKPKKVYHKPTDVQRAALCDLVEKLKALPEDASAEAIQTEVYAIGNSHFTPLKGWFDCLYQVLLGQTEGPRFGVFVALYGISSIIRLIEEKVGG